MPTFADPKMNRAYMRWYMREYRRKHQAKPKASRPETSQPKIGGVIRTSAPLEFRQAHERWKRSGEPAEKLVKQAVESGFSETDVFKWMKELA